MADNVKRFKKGEFLFRENDPITVIYVIQSGKVALNVERAGKRLEVMTAGHSQILGEQALFTNARHMFTGEVLQEVKALEVPLEVLKTQINSAVPGVKLVLKSLVDEARQVRQMLRSLKMETDKAPCPQNSIPRIFTILNLVARHTGKKDAEKPNDYVVDWNTIKLYATRMFGESPQRMRGMLDLLTKLKYCEMEFGQSEEGDEMELKRAHVFNLQIVEDFAEFYQYNLYKGSYAEVIHVDKLALKVARALVALSEGLEPDRKGAVGLIWDQLMTDIKTKFSIDLKNTHLDALEKKGLFVKKQAREKEPTLLMFDRNEFDRVSTYWQIIHEIDKWNERGTVQMVEKEVAAGPTVETCPACQGVLEAVHKFCPHCGHKLEKAA